jgi:hypothetical protein
VRLGAAAPRVILARQSLEEPNVKSLMFVSLVVLSACAASPESKEPTASEVSSSSSQMLVDRFANQYPEIARLSIHKQRPDGDWRIVASTVTGRVGERSDAEDAQALKTSSAIVLQEGHNLDYTVPVRDERGRTLAIIGLTLTGTVGDRATLLSRAEQISGQIATEIRSKGMD